MELDGFELTGSSGTVPQLTFQKENFTITYYFKGEGRGIAANVCERSIVDNMPQYNYQPFDRLEKAIKYVNEKLGII